MEIKAYRYREARPVKRHSFLRRFLALVLITVLLLSGAGFTYSTLTQALPTITPSVSALSPLAAEAVALNWPTQGQAAIGSLEEGILAMSSEGQTPRPIASIAKVVTALAIMRAKPFAAGEQGTILTLDTQDVAYYSDYLARNGSIVPVQVGEQLSQYQALEALLLPSANNIADSLVRWAFGSMDAYKLYADDMVKEFGMLKTTIDDASGFSPRTLSTPTDLIILGQKILSDPVLSGIVAKRETSVPVARTIRNTNHLLADSRVVGIKTGNTDEAGGCLLFAAKHIIDDTHSVTVIGAVLGSPTIGSVFPASSSLLESAFKGFGIREVVKKDSVIGSYQTPWGQTTNIVASDSILHYGWKGSSISPEISTVEINTPATKDQVVGAIKVPTKQGITATPLTITSSLAQPSTWWRISNRF